MVYDEELAKRERVLEKQMYQVWQRDAGATNDRDLRHLRNCIALAVEECLTPCQRDVLTLYMIGYNQLEIAKMRKVDKSTVSRTLNRAMDNLFNHIKYATPMTLKNAKRIRKNLTRLYRKG